MKIDLFYFDKKGRYYQFYLGITFWGFLIGISIDKFDTEFSIGYYPDTIRIPQEDRN